MTEPSTTVCSGSSPGPGRTTAPGGFPGAMSAARTWLCAELPW
ncbi:hypothetical protein ACIG3E_17635 [Streptomyces sp. NPDC053474]